MSFINHELVSTVECLVSVFPDIVKDCPKMRNLPKIFLRSFENVGPEAQCVCLCEVDVHIVHRVATKFGIMSLEAQWNSAGFIGSLRSP